MYKKWATFAEKWLRTRLLLLINYYENEKFLPKKVSSFVLGLFDLVTLTTHTQAERVSWQSNPFSRLVLTLPTHALSQKKNQLWAWWWAKSSSGMTKSNKFVQKVFCKIGKIAGRECSLSRAPLSRAPMELLLSEGGRQREWPQATIQGKPKTGIYWPSWQRNERNGEPDDNGMCEWTRTGANQRPLV